MNKLNPNKLWVYSQVETDTKGNEHGLKFDGNDTGFKQCCGICSCGWQSPVVDGQTKKSEDLIRLMWRSHLAGV